MVYSSVDYLAALVIRGAVHVAIEHAHLPHLVTFSGGYVAVASDGDIAGVAQKAATNVTSSHITIPVQMITPDSIWIMAADTTTAVTHVNEDYGLNYTAGSMSVDLGGRRITQMRIEKLDTRDGAASLGRVHVRFKQSVLKDW